MNIQPSDDQRPPVSAPQVRRRPLISSRNRARSQVPPDAQREQDLQEILSKFRQLGIDEVRKGPKPATPKIRRKHEIPEGGIFFADKHVASASGAFKKCKLATKNVADDYVVLTMRTVTNGKTGATETIRPETIVAEIGHMKKYMAPEAPGSIFFGHDDRGRVYVAVPNYPQSLNSLCRSASTEAEYRANGASALRVGHQLSCTLAKMHGDGLVHRDVKPGNVRLDAEGNARLIDYGLTLPEGASFDAFGTVAFLPVENIPHRRFGPEESADLIASKAGDTWALGLVLLHVLAGVEAKNGPFGVSTLQAYSRIGELVNLRATIYVNDNIQVSPETRLGEHPFTYMVRSAQRASPGLTALIFKSMIAPPAERGEMGVISHALASLLEVSESEP